MDNKITKTKVASNLVWRFAERMGAQIVSFIVSLVLARLLLPDDYGTVALITVFTNILQVFVDSGMANALIQKKDADDLDFSTAFFFNVGICFLVYLLLFVCAPLIAAFYKKPELTPLTRVIGLTIVISGLKNVQQAYVSRHLIFKKFFFATLIGTVASAFLGIFLAYKGAGPWALVAQQLTNTTVDTIMLWILVPWRPRRKFSLERFRSLFSFGWKLLVSSLLDTIYNNLRQLIIGRLYSSSDLAFYNKGRQFPELVITNVNTSINSVLLPVMSQSQDDRDRVKSMMRRSIKLSCFIIWPLLMGLAAVATPITRIILTEKWIPLVPYMRVFCFCFALWPIHTTNLNAINALGRSDIFLKLEVIKKVLDMALLLLTMRKGPMVMAYSLLLSGVICSIINAYPNKRLLRYSYVDQLKDILPDVTISLIMCVFVYLVTKLNLNDWITLAIQVPLGIAIYYLLARITRNESLTYLLDAIKKRKEQR